MRQLRSTQHLRLNVGLSYSQIGRWLGVPKATVGNTMLLARAAVVTGPDCGRTFTGSAPGCFRRPRVRFRRGFDDVAATGERANYVRFKLQPRPAVAMAARVKRPGKGFLGEQRELFLCENEAGEELPFERLLGDAMAGDGALFASQVAVEAAWAIVDGVLIDKRPVLPYVLGSWGPGGRRPDCG